MKLSVNKRSDPYLMMNMVERSLSGKGAPISPAWAMETVGEIEQPFQMYQEWLTWKWLMSPESQNFYMKLLQQETESELQQDEGMTPEELQQLVQQGAIPPEIAQRIMVALLGEQAEQTPLNGGPTGNPTGVNLLGSEAT